MYMIARNSRVRCFDKKHLTVYSPILQLVRDYQCLICQHLCINFKLLLHIHVQFVDAFLFSKCWREISTDLPNKYCYCLMLMLYMLLMRWSWPQVICFSCVHPCISNPKIVQVLVCFFSTSKYQFSWLLPSNSGIDPWFNIGKHEWPTYDLCPVNFISSWLGFY